MNIFKIVTPPDKWLFPVIIVSAFMVGLVLFLVYISNAPSYLSDQPKTCVNCHIMAPQYATWMHSSHRERATCNDCHVPQDNLFNTYYFKGKDGLRHATIFTLRAEPQVIQIKDAGKKVVQQNCIRCHIDLVTDVKMNTIHPEFHSQRSDKKCWDCHREIPHGRVNSLSSTPNAKVPLPESPVPDWLKKVLKETK
ncbi:MAG: cytochrome c nitrite reductase small subunit [Breznakibacter sp.]